MPKFIISLCLAFSLFAAPAAHAAGLECVGDSCHFSAASGDHAGDQQQDAGKMAAAGHHCCCPAFFALPDLPASGPMIVSGRTLFVPEQPALASIVVGPGLKPPSYS